MEIITCPIDHIAKIDYEILLARVILDLRTLVINNTNEYNYAVLSTNLGFQ